MLPSTEPVAPWCAGDLLHAGTDEVPLPLGSLADCDDVVFSPLRITARVCAGMLGHWRIRSSLPLRPLS